MKKYTLSLLFILGLLGASYAQQRRAVSNLELLDSQGRVATIPYFGLRNLLIFYVDPDRIGQNDNFVQELRQNPKLRDIELYGVTIINSKDAPNISERLLYKIAQKRSEANNTQFLIDPTYRLRDEWRMGDCDNYSIVMVVSKSGELLFVSRGRITDDDKARFYGVIEAL